MTMKGNLMHSEDNPTAARRTGAVAVTGTDGYQDRIATVAATRGLVAFWDFEREEGGRWTSYRDPRVVDRAFPVALRHIGDAAAYGPADWPYHDPDAALVIDRSGPFGHAVRFNRGHIFADVARRDFDATPLDIHGRQPLTLVAWVKFLGPRHLIAGIWDEGGWDLYGGRRQVALFGGLFGSDGVIAHISATGAASYPQSTARGAQYARARAIDGCDVRNDQWLCAAMTVDPSAHQVTAYCDGAATGTWITDPVAEDVFHYGQPVASNPFDFSWPIYSPRAFVVKFNGYKVTESGVYEHWLRVDAASGDVTYDRHDAAVSSGRRDFRVTVDLLRDGVSVYPAPFTARVTPKLSLTLPVRMPLRPGDELVAQLDVWDGGAWHPVGTPVRYRLREGAPFTFGRALGLGDDAIDHGSQLCLDGVAVFNRVLAPAELRALSFRATGTSTFA